MTSLKALVGKDVSLIHYGEIGTKGKNRSKFERVLLKNVRAQCGCKPFLFMKRLLCEGRVECNVFGVEHVTYGTVVEGGLEQWLQFIEQHVDREVGADVKRVDKSLPFTSLDVKHAIKRRVKQFNYKSPHKVFVEIYDEQRAFIGFERVKGLGGLPVGVSGRAVVLLSGGIDSPVAAFKMMGRGVEPLFLHLGDNTSLQKVKEIVGVLRRYAPSSLTLFAAPCPNFKHYNINKRLAHVLFRTVAHVLAERLAIKRGAVALVNGDALPQVASQTISNVCLPDRFVSLPVLRPLIGYSKLEIITLAQRIGTFSLSIKPAPDCCSSHVKQPSTNVSVELLRKEVERINLNAVVDKLEAEVVEVVV